MGKGNILRDKEEGSDDKEGEVTEVGGDLAESVIPGDQVQKCSERGEVTGLQGSTKMSKMQWPKSIHYALHQVTGESRQGWCWRAQEKNWSESLGIRGFSGWERSEYVYMVRGKSMMYLLVFRTALCNMVTTGPT